MNSFYGQVRWGEQFQRFFYEFRLTNREYSTGNIFNQKPSIDKTLDTVDNNHRIWIRPDKDFAKFDINAANHWIKLVPLDAKGDSEENGTNLGFSLFHNSPDVDNSTVIPMFSIVATTSLPSGAVIEEISSGQYFKIANPKFDQAGHFTGRDDVDEKYFKFPDQTIRLNNKTDLKLKPDGKFHFFEKDSSKSENNLIQLTINGSNNELVFSHKTFFDKDKGPKYQGIYFEGRRTGTQFATTEVLEPGDFISTHNMIFDESGHLTKIEKIYYQLPYSDNEKRLDALEKSVTEINQEIKSIKDRVKKNEDSITVLNSLKNQLGSDSEFSAMASALSLLTGKSYSKNTSVATGIAAVANHVNEQVEEQITGIYSRLSNLDDFIKSKHSDYVKPQ